MFVKYILFLYIFASAIYLLNISCVKYYCYIVDDFDTCILNFKVS